MDFFNMTISKSLFNLLIGDKKTLLLTIIFVLVSVRAVSFQINDSLQTASADSIIFHDFDGSNYQASSFNYTSVEDEDGIMYFGNENGLLEFDGSHWRLYRTPNYTPITYLKIVGDKIYTFGSNEFGFFQRNKIGNMIYHPLNDRSTDEIDISYIWKILEHNGDVYFSADSLIFKWDGEILKRIQADNKYLTMYNVEDELLVSFYGKNGGLALLEKDTFNFVNKSFNFQEDYAWEIIQKEDEEWLLFTSENGVFKLDPETYETEVWDNEINQYFLQDSTYLYYVERYQDSLFLGSTWQNGIVLFNDEGDIIRKLDKKSGLLTNYYSYPIEDRRGNIWLTTEVGLQYLEFYNPEEEEFNFKPQTKVRYIKLGDSSVFIRDTNHVLSISENKSNSIDFYFSVPSFFKENLQFSYYLDGFDEDWSEWTNNTRKEYTNLSGGKYTFHLKARSLNNPDLEIQSFEFDIIVPTKWYESYITYVLLAVLLSLLIFGFIKYRTHRLSITNKKLEKIVKKRTSELRSQKERLKQANEELKTINNELDNFVYRSSHDLVAPLKSLRGLISVAEMSDRPEDIREYFKYMNVSITKLEEFIKSIMDFSTNTKKPLEMKPVKMDFILDSIVEDLKFYANADKVKLIRAYNSDFEIKTDPKRLNIVLSNLVTNALKYHDFEKDESPYIKVSAKVKDNSYVIEVEDNGSGIPEEYQSKIFEMFFRAHQGIEGSGLGLYIVVDTLNVLKGTIDFTSKTRKGTKFTILLPFVN
ncbi:HAMP domain-containing sensor histidine kinase [Marivirga salinae]|uniref:histidine kinase n=1 Tax=Marivirga salinarum TaxID=3059078 RepID=A0AA51NBW6_9BACT|nr:HAMP domain-containing sensor histidine kinase [Marivirga sp. BDSF4-3]WMN12439.1 HAMP domain-containing sensor histidine kinase [Marivirga sp. BDSF4-3]